MLKNSLFIVCLFVFLLLIGCGTSSTSPSTETVSTVIEKAATFHFFREEKWQGSIASPSIFIDGKKVLKLTNGSYSTIKVEAGEKLVELKHGFFQKGGVDNLSAEVSISENENIYIEYIWGHVDYKATGVGPVYLIGKANNYLFVVPEEEALQKINSLKFIEPF